MHKHTVDVIGIEGGNEIAALRGHLECWDTRANVFWTGQPRHIVDVLGGKEPRAKHIVLSSHGDADGFCMVELAPELAGRQPFNAKMTPTDVEKYLSFDGSVVVSSACMTGHRKMADAFLAKGATHYIAPNDYPDGSAALYFMTSFYYYLFCGALSVEEAYAKAKGRDRSLEMFELFK